MHPARRSSRTRSTALLSATVVLAAACSDHAVPTFTTFESLPADTAAVRGMAVDLSGPMPVLRVAVSPSVRTVDVTYWSDSTGGFRVRGTAGSGETLAVALPRVLAGRSYSYAVRATGELSAVPDTAVGTFESPALPADLAAIPLVATGRPTHALTLMEIVGKYRGFVIVNGAGEVVWHRRAIKTPNGSTRRTNGNFVFIDVDNALLEVAPTGEVVHRLAAQPALGILPHHDVIVTPQNTLLFLSLDPQGPEGRKIVGDAIYEWTPETGELVKRWSTFDALDPSVDWTEVSLATDWVHANAIALGPRGNVILSMRFLDQVLSISPDWTRVEWRMGGPGSTIQQMQPVAFGGQHTAQELPNGNILLFDNSWNGKTGAKVSRFIELALDMQAGTATPVWEYSPSPVNFAPFVGSARRLHNGNTLGMFGVTAGASGGSGPVQAVEVNAAGEPQWTLTIGNVTYAYRATPVDRLLDETPVSADEIRRLGARAPVTFIAEQGR